MFGTTAIRFKLWKMLYHSLLILLLLTSSVAAQETYKFERLWPSLLSPAHFDHPQGIAIDDNGFVYVADSNNHCIRKFTDDGYFIAKWGKRGNRAGEFETPGGIAVDPDGFVYVADTGNHRIQKFTFAGAFVTIYGEQGSGDAQFQSPQGVATDRNGNIYIADTGNNRILKLNANGRLIQKWDDEDMFDAPCDLVVTGGNALLVADAKRIQKFDTDGLLAGEWGEFGHCSGGNDCAPGKFIEPVSINLDAQGNIYVLDKENRVQKFDSDGLFTGIGAQGLEMLPSDTQSDCGVDLFCGAVESHFTLPQGLAIDRQGFIYVADSGNNRIQKFTSDGAFMNTWQSYSRHFDVKDKKLHSPQGIAIDSDGSVYVADTANHRIRQFTADGQYLNEWGGFGNENNKMNRPFGVAAQNDILYAADTGNNRIVKFKNGEIVIWESFGDNDTFNQPRGITIDKDKNLYVADSANQRILKFDKTGILQAQWNGFSVPWNVAADTDGKAYAVDTGADAILKLDDNQWTRIDIELNAPRGIAVDSNGNIYVADTGNHRILKLNQQGELLAAFGSFGNAPGEFNQPAAIRVNSQGRVYVTDTGNHRIQAFRKSFDTDKTMKAIIVAGGGPYRDNELWDATQLCANMAYRALLNQGFSNLTIRYLTYLSDVDTELRTEEEFINATGDNLEWAVTQWAQNADNLAIYLVDHGGIQNFRFSQRELLNAGELAGWLDELQNTLPGVVTVAYDACHSGSFINALKPANGQQRIVLTGTASDQDAYFIINGLISFSSYFWGHISNSLNLQTAFDRASSAIHQSFEHQTPMMDDSDNLAPDTYIGNGAATGQQAPEIINISVPSTIQNQNHATITVEAIDEDDDIANVWAVVQPLECADDKSEAHKQTDSFCKNCYAMRLVMIDMPTAPADTCTQHKAGGPVTGMPYVDLNPVDGRPGHYETVYTGFDQETTYQVNVYAQDAAGNISAPAVTEIKVENTFVNRAVVLAGGKETGPLWSVIANLVKLACEVFAIRGYTDDVLQLLSPVSISEIAYSNITPSLSNLHNAIEQCAASGTQDFVLYMVGAEGDEEAFPLASDEILTAEQLDLWLDDLQASIRGTVTVIYDGCKSGSFLKKLTSPQDKPRIVIASTSENRTALFDAQGDLSFSAYFWSQIRNGATLEDAFKYARKAIEYITMHLPGGYIKAELDDNGNGTGNDTDDGKLAKDHTIFAGPQMANVRPSIGEVSSPIVLRDGTTAALIYAADVTSLNGIDRVWMAIIPPDTDSSAIPLTGLPMVELLYNPVTQRYEGVYNDFSMNGIYGISVHASDIIGNLSKPAATKVIQLNAPQTGRIKAISAGGCIGALANNGDVWSWGSNYSGILGDGTNVDSSTPVKAVGISDVIAIDVGDSHTLALREDGTVWAWGNNELGQLGDGSQINRYTPAQVPNLSNVIAISAGLQHSATLKEDGTVWTWGDRDFQLGLKETSLHPVKVLNIPNIVKIKSDAIGFFTLALDIEGNVWRWGQGIGSSKYPVQVENIENSIDISPGSTHIIALGEDGKVRAWGDNQFGQLGIGIEGDQSTPVQVDYFSDDITIKIDAGLYSSLVVRDESVYAWGFNAGGILGNGELINSYTPRKVLNTSNVKEIAAGLRCSIALLNDGSVWTWGQNYFGQLGDGTETNRYTPAPVVWTGFLQMNISEVLSEDVFLKVDDWEWQQVKKNVIKVPEGIHTLAFSRIPCYSIPDSVNIVIREGETLEITPEYTPIQDCTPGDINNDDTVDLKDAILALKIVTGYNPSEFEYGNTDVDINGDDRVGMDELLYILEVVAEQR